MLLCFACSLTALSAESSVARKGRASVGWRCHLTLNCYCRITHVEVLEYSIVCSVDAYVALLPWCSVA